MYRNYTTIGILRKWCVDDLPLKWHNILRCYKSHEDITRRNSNNHYLDEVSRILIAPVVTVYTKIYIDTLRAYIQKILFKRVTWLWTSFDAKIGEFQNNHNILTHGIISPICLTQVKKGAESRAYKNVTDFRGSKHG